MDKHFSIFCSDQISKDGKRFAISALEDAIWQASVYGVPSNLSHDIHRPVGWSYAKGLYFEPTKVLSIGYFLIADNDADIAKIEVARKAFFTNLWNREIDPYAERFKVTLNGLYNEGQGNWFSSGVVLYGYDDIVYKAFPKLSEHITNDKDGLVNLDYLLAEFDYLTQGIFKKKGSDLCIIAHPFFRKSLSIYNNFHWIFLDELVSLNGHKGITLKIKIEPNYLGFAPSFVPSHEFEFWWGPKYDDDITAIHPGLTQYGSEEFEKLYYNIDRTEFVWKNEDNLYTLELEEVKTQPAPTLADTYACRYVHSIFDKNKNGFDHFDGAIRAYSTELMLDRIDKKMTEMGRRSEYTKLFRIDGNLPLSNWKSLVTNYLQGNPQIYEYFGLPKPGIQSVLESETLTPFEKYLPYSINKDDGVRLYISYSARVEEQPHPRFVSSHDELTLEDGTHKAIEYFTIELKKALSRIGADLVLPDDCLFLIPEDYYSNIPCIFHSDENCQKHLKETINGIKLLLQRLVMTSKKEVLSISLAWNMDEKEVCMSVMGHVSDLELWFNSYDDIPVEREQFKVWLEKQAVYIKANGRETPCPVLSEIIYDDGILYMKRRLVQRDAVLNFPDKKDLFNCELDFDKDKDDLAKTVKEGQLFIAPTMILKKMLCEKSGLDYTVSPYSVVLDDDTTQKLVDCKLISFHWTDKPRPIAFS